jgi:comEA protein
MFGFSRNEVRAILLLISLLLIGSGITLYQRYRANQRVDIVSVIERSVRTQGTSLSAENEGTRTAESASREPSETEKRGPSSPKIDINTANAYELEGLPGIGPVLARRIIEYRDKHGRFQTLSELKKVNGIGDAKLEAIRDRSHIE